MSRGACTGEGAARGWARPATKMELVDRGYCAEEGADRCERHCACPPGAKGSSAPPEPVAPACGAEKPSGLGLCPLGIIFLICSQIHSWLNLYPENLVVSWVLAGSGLTAGPGG